MDKVPVSEPQCCLKEAKLWLKLAKAEKKVAAWEQGVVKAKGKRKGKSARGETKEVTRAKKTIEEVRIELEKSYHHKDYFKALLPGASPSPVEMFPPSPARSAALSPSFTPGSPPVAPVQNEAPQRSVGTTGEIQYGLESLVPPPVLLQVLPRPERRGPSLLPKKGKVAHTSKDEGRDEDRKEEEGGKKKKKQKKEKRRRKDSRKAQQRRPKRSVISMVPFRSTASGTSGAAMPQHMLDLGYVHPDSMSLSPALGSKRQGAGGGGEELAEQEGEEYKPEGQGGNGGEEESSEGPMDAGALEDSDDEYVSLLFFFFFLLFLLLLLLLSWIGDRPGVYGSMNVSGSHIRNRVHTPNFKKKKKKKGKT